MKLKTITLQGREYVQVLERIKYFRENYKNGSIQTDVQIIGDRAIFTANIYIDDKLIAKGHSMKNISSEFMLEKAETRAIGRALGIAGIGIDCGVSTYEEVREFLDHAEKPKKKKKEEVSKETEKQLELQNELIKHPMSRRTEAFEKAGITQLYDATIEQCDKAINYLKGVK